jgi:hypothetical protein
MGVCFRSHVPNYPPQQTYVSGFTVLSVSLLSAQCLFTLCCLWIYHTSGVSDTATERSTRQRITASEGMPT